MKKKPTVTASIKVGDYEARVKNGILVFGEEYEDEDGTLKFSTDATVTKAQALKLLRDLERYQSLDAEIDKARVVVDAAQDKQDGLEDEQSDLQNYDEIDDYGVTLSQGGVQFGCTFVPTALVKKLISLLK